MDETALKIVLAVLSFGLALVSTLFWRLWQTLASKTELGEVERRIAENDAIQDERMVLRFAAEMVAARTDVLRMHAENQGGIKRIEDILLSRTATVKLNG